jgi:hypothetical protein
MDNFADMVRLPVPEPAAVITGALLLLPFGASPLCNPHPAVSESVTLKSVSITLQGSGAGPGEGSPWAPAAIGTCGGQIAGDRSQRHPPNTQGRKPRRKGGAEYDG